MALAALISAYHESGEAGHLRATLPLAGRTVVERQARLAASAGANPVVIFVERLPAALSAAVERLRRDRVPVQLVRSAEEAAEAVDPFDRVLLVGDGAIIPAAQQLRLASEKGPVVLTVPEGAHGELYERIDAQWRWAGLAAIDGALLRETATMLRDWDFQSTLLRRTLQAGAGHVEADNAATVAILDRDEDLDELERRIIAGADVANRSWSDYLLSPLERLATLLLIGSGLSPQLVGFGAALLTLLGAGAFYLGWSWLGLAFLLAATPLEGIATRLGRLRMQSSVRQSWWAYLIPLCAAAAFVILAYRLMPLYGWGITLLPFVTLAFLHALSVETEAGPVAGAVLLAERRGMVWLLLPFALFGLWPAGFVFLAAYAAASFFWAQQRVHAREAGAGNKLVRISAALTLPGIRKIMAETGAYGREKQNDAARLLLAAARERFAVAAADLLLPDAARLSEWQRLTAAALLARLIHSIEGELRTRLAVSFEAHPAVHAALSSARVPIALPILERAQVLRDAELGNVLVRRVEEHRFWKAHAPEKGEDLLFELVRDGDEQICAGAMELVIARSRRFDRFQEPDMGQVELPAELQHKLVWLVAAALRQYVVQQHALPAVDGVIEEAAGSLIALHDEGATLEAHATRLAMRLAATDRLDGALLLRMLSEGLLPMFIAGAAVLTGLDYAATWEVIADPRGRGPAILLRAAGIAREEAAAILLLANSNGPLVSGTEGDATAEQLELYDSLDRPSAEEVLTLWRAAPGYRTAVARVATRGRPADAA